MTEDVLYMTALELREHFRARSLSPVEVMVMHLARIEATEPFINATTQVYAEGALREAALAEQRYRDGDARHLEGIPVATKAEQPIAGEPAPEGCVLLGDEVATLTHPLILRIRDAGGIVHARTTTPEFCAAGFTHSELWGVTRNPWNRDYSPGGSSGGSGAALASGQTTLATGNDIAGSLRMPASASGVVTFKPPHGRVPGVPPWNNDTYLSDGPMTRSVEDCALLQNVIAGQHPACAISIPNPPDVTIDVPVRAVALCLRLGDFPLLPEVEAAGRAAGEHLRNRGARVDEIDLPWRRADIIETALVHYGHGFGSVATLVRESERHRLMPYTLDLMERSLSAARGSSPMVARVKESEMYDDPAKVFADYDVLLAPTMGLAAFEAGRDYVEEKLAFDGRACGTHLEAALTIPFNMTNRCPVLVVPVATSRDGVPIGVQLVAPPYADQVAFSAGRMLEGIRPWCRTDDWRPSL